MPDLSDTQRLARLEAVAFPRGILTAEDGGISITPAPTPLRMGETSTPYTVTGLDTDPAETIILYSSPMNIATATRVAGTLNQFVLHGLDSGPAGARSEISVQRSHGLGGLTFPLDVLPAV